MGAYLNYKTISNILIFISLSFAKFIFNFIGFNSLLEKFLRLILVDLLNLNLLKLLLDFFLDLQLFLFVFSKAFPKGE